MTPKERVLKRMPSAKLVSNTTPKCNLHIIYRWPKGRGIQEPLSAWMPSPDEAWADAARRLKEKSEQGEAMTTPKPVDEGLVQRAVFALKHHGYNAEAEAVDAALRRSGGAAP